MSGDRSICEDAASEGQPMGRSATQLGIEFGKSGREMNQLLLAHGFMEGPPGAYRPTTLGEPFATAVDVDNGYGGFAHRQWGWLTWDDDVVDALKASIQANPEGVANRAVETAPAAVPAASETSRRVRRTPPLTKGQWIALGGAATALGLAATPQARRLWREKVKPSAARLSSRLTRESPSATDDSGPEVGPELDEA